MEGDCNYSRYERKCNSISIHSLRMEGDAFGQDSALPPPYFNPLPPHGGRPCQFLFAMILLTFQSTPSAWRETLLCATSGGNSLISIHSLRMEGDDNIRIYRMLRIHFNPLPPHGGRLSSHYLCPGGSIFQSTPSAWRETASTTGWKDSCTISIHSLRMEGD